MPGRLQPLADTGPEFAVSRSRKPPAVQLGPLIRIELTRRLSGYFTCMKPLRALALAFSLLIGLEAWAVPALLYVSESGDKRLAVYAMDDTSGELTRRGAVDLPGAPGTFALSADRRRVYVALRTKQFVTLTADPATGLLSNPVVAPAGSNPAFVQVDKTGKWLLAASHGDGVVTVSRITNGVVTGEPITTLPTGKYPHSIHPDPANRFVLVPHVRELSKVEQLRFDASTGALTPNTPPSMSAGAGQGPRYLQFHPNGRWVYLVTEQGRSVIRCDYDAATGTLTLRQTIATTPPENGPAKGSCADIHISADGKFAYASNRGPDTLAVFSIDARSGELKFLGHTPTEKTPHSFCLMGNGDNFVVSAGYNTNRLMVFRRDPGSGALTPLKAYDCGKGPVSVLGVKG